RSMLKPKIIERLNNQVTSETYASQLYLQMSLWCEDRGMHGAAAFFRAHVPEEIKHRDKLIDYLVESGASVEIQAVPAPSNDFSTLVEVLQAAYQHEQKVTHQIHSLAEAAMEEKDFSTFNMLQWFIAEQREEIVLFRGIVEHIELTGFTGENGTAMVQMNRYLHRLVLGSSHPELD
ncbi:MAG: ferritin, partial [Halothiobacillaceae bacterium]|nr:ferritin [Halothiobacillaceae bacterium]